ncbi:3-dehydroquinate synthase [Candidatus Woesearchaeota archaeon]|nr:3-dehydroquinate synthase [Candidatus Woesearchaeota archaeon]
MVIAVGNTLRIGLESIVDDSYDIVFGENLFPQIAEDLAKVRLGSKYAIITDSNVNRLYGAALKSALESAGLQADIFPFEAGEQSKNAVVFLGLMKSMRELDYGRDSAIIALGGGVVGDMAGLIAAIYLRGIPYIQVPTTTLAQADSSIGGKTAVDTEDAKNSIGAFKQPARVYIDVATLVSLKELDNRGYVSGFAEAVKHGIIRDPVFFAYLQKNAKLVLECDPETMLYVAKQNCRIKGTVVEQDPKEKGLRQILNYGHTIGHAVETLSGYRRLHGDCVSMGMMVSGNISAKLEGLSEQELEQQKELLQLLGLPIWIPPEISNESIIQVTLKDKKARGGAARYALLKHLGEMHDFAGKYTTPVDNAIVIAALNATRMQH